MQSDANEFSETCGQVIRDLREARGLRQIDLASDLAIGTASMSRWEADSPDVKLRRSDIDNLARFLSLNDAEKERLEAAWMRTYLERSGFLPSRGMEHAIDGTIVSIDVVRELRKIGKPRLARRIADNDTDRILTEIKQLRWQPGHNQALSSVTELMLESMKAALDYLPRQEVRGGALAPTLKRQATVAKASGSPAAVSLHLIASEGADWVAENYGSAHQTGLDLLNDFDDLPREWKPEVLRASAINAGQVSDGEALSKVNDRFERWLDDAQPENGTHGFVLEGLARGHGRTDLDKAYGYLETARGLRSRSSDFESRSELRNIQIVRTQAMVELDSGNRSNATETKRELENALSTATAQGYTRYVDSLTTLRERFEA